MRTEYNIYCNERYHLENHESKSMVLGAIRCPKDKVNDISDEILSLKQKYYITPTREMKWIKVSPSKIEFFCDLINYFFENENLHCRILVKPEESEIIHTNSKHIHNDSYYQMYSALLNKIFEPGSSYFIYIDFKSNRNMSKVSILKDVLQANCLDISKEFICEVQHIPSHEAELLQLTDILIGAFSYLIFNNSHSSPSKLRLLAQIKRLSSSSEKNKLSILIWDPPLKNRGQNKLANENN